MQKLIMALAATALLVGSMTTPAAALVRSHSGKTLAVYTEMPTTIGPGTFTATILKGKKKSGLVIEVTASVISIVDAACITEVSVNGQLAYPQTGAFNTVCTSTPTGNALASAVYWLDIDEAEQLSPGAFVNQPLNVVVKTSTESAGGSGGISIVVRMEKK